MEPLQKVLIIGLNEIISRGVLAINGTTPPGYLFFSAGSVRCVGNWHDVGYGDTRVSIWWNYDKSKNPNEINEKYTTSEPLCLERHYKDFVGALVSTFVSNESGFFIRKNTRPNHRHELKIHDTYLRAGEGDVINTVDEQMPKGFNIIRDMISAQRTYTP
ncbi:hypothetical protein AA23498_1339 [Acetobacter nitrogenifigens DSM 23921 = NBRC 105050]|uniref:Uncharacterized protein n=1 Tax=Acetobacter nitrogenifigens DSM 23921 = NBRC 105050 TaxID=1120919 RepID=A0A511X5E6_9PROT|nr:hypothetical protein AA23498_1339 [Acetobacter nitrogenifigens DSM 23921 = NBRC 105050]GEN58154.1 hypothetical protein ANI02nite_00380 [Acetobacter nitrogenifigens DSM 23921 = NBRC 105050]